MALRMKINQSEINVGDLVRVHQRIKEGKKQRTQIFEGIVLAIKGHHPNCSFTVRKISSGNVGVEMIWPVLSPSIAKIEVKKKGDVRRSKLYYLRGRVGRQATKVKEKKVATKVKKDEKKKTRKSGRKPSPKKASK
jgi:large subunit ribosomal protein L19